MYLKSIFIFVVILAIARGELYNSIKFIYENFLIKLYNFPADGKTKCDRVPKHYEELGCTGVYNDGGDCPTRLELKLSYFQLVSN